jgi:membrane protein YqaA with SNARE-associated domain
MIEVLPQMAHVVAMGLATGYLGLFIVAFVAATILPVQSEAVLGAMIVSDAFSVPLLLTVATVGNTLGAVVNWWMGLQVVRFRNSRWFPVSPTNLERAQAQYQKWGRWSLLFSWVPFGGDALTVIAGVMREPLLPFAIFVGIGKFLRYLVVTAAIIGFFG